MAKFMLIYRGAPEPASRPSPEEMQAVLAAWGEWFGKLGGALIDGGDGLKPQGRVLKHGGVVTDGPYVESKEVVGGYSVIQAETIDEAIELARGCPIHGCPVAGTGGTIEVREFAGYN